MNILDALIQIIQIFKWPITIIFITFILKKPLSDLISYIQTIKYKDLEIKFSRKLDVLSKGIKELPCSIDVIASDDVKVKDSADINKILESTGSELYHELAKIEPRSAIIESWRKLELAISKQAEKLGVEAKRDIIKALKILNRSKLIDDGEMHIIHELRIMRNEAAHAPSFTLTVLDAIKYADLANRLTCYIEDRKL